MNQHELDLFIDLVSDLLDHVEPCNIDPQRPYCVTHHQRHCLSDELVHDIARMIGDYQKSLEGEESDGI